MTYFADLTHYTYWGPAARSQLNVGWLDEQHEVPTEPPSVALLDSLWEHCKTIVRPTRGLHPCALCTNPPSSFVRHETRLLLGSGEICVFGPTGLAYAAPNLIYHYVFEHHYRPPGQFLQAIAEGPPPGSSDYLARMRELEINWRAHLPIDREPEKFRFTRVEDGVEREVLATGATKLR